ncbi:MAG: hypothetical protein ACUVSQ_11940 [Pseudanabaenaceae cyanobacterium]
MARQEVILLFWDCPECGHKHIPGPTRRCPQCFWWRDRTVNFYEAPDSVVLSPEEAARYAGPDWICKVCGAANPETGEPREHLICGNCNSWQTNDQDLGHAPPQTLPTGVPLTTPPSRQPNRLVKPIALGIVCGLGILGLAIGIWRLSRPRVVTAEVVGRRWQVQVPIEDQRPVVEEDWTLPAGAYNVSSEQRQRSTREVPVGTTTTTVEVPYQEEVGTREECTTTSRGDGTGDRTCRDVPVYETRYRSETREETVYRTEPVYDTWYRYTIQRWQPLRTATAVGTENTPRQPPAFQLATQPYPQRALSPQETCFLDVRVQTQLQSWEIPCPEYDLVRTGQTRTFWQRGNRVTRPPTR